MNNEKEESKKEKWPSSEKIAEKADLFIFCEECSKKDSCKEYTDGHKESPCYHSLMIKAKKCKEDYEKEKEFNLKLLDVEIIHNVLRKHTKKYLTLKWADLVDKITESKLDKEDEQKSDDAVFAEALAEAINALDTVIRSQEEEIADTRNKIYHH